jgi:hypothetical protein
MHSGAFNVPANAQAADTVLCGQAASAPSAGEIAQRNFTFAIAGQSSRRRWCSSPP